MVMEKSRLEELTVPELPSYKRDFVREMGKYLCTRKIYSIPLEIDFQKANTRQIRAINKKRKLTKAGVIIMHYSSKFLDNNVVPEKLAEASKSLYEGITRLEEYEVTDGSLSAVHDLSGEVVLPPLAGLVGGRAPIEGEMSERKPSGFSSFQLPDESSKEYLSELRKTLLNSVPPLEQGFKSQKKDKNFGLMLKSVFTAENLSQAHVKAVNDSVRSVHADAKNTYKLANYFENAGLNNLYELPLKEEIRKLKESGFKVMHPFREKAAEYANKLQIPGTIGGIFGGSVVAATFFKSDPLLALLGISAGVAVPTSLMILNNYDDILEERQSLQNMISCFPDRD